MKGQRVKILADEKLNERRSEWMWEGDAGNGHQLTAGLCLVLIPAANRVFTGKVSLIRE